jgi:hypothetical protein
MRCRSLQKKLDGEPGEVNELTDPTCNQVSIGEDFLRTGDNKAFRSRITT